jgi:hypothetical protein
MVGGCGAMTVATMSTGTTTVVWFVAFPFIVSIKNGLSLVGLYSMIQPA